MQETCRLKRTAPYMSLQGVLYVEVTQCNAAFSCCMRKEKWNKTVENAAADLMSFKMQNDSAKLRTSSGKSELSCCHQ